MSNTILVFGAHNDDHIIGAGGTLIKYAKEGKKVKTFIFSYGEVSHPHLKPEVIIAKRIKEAREADKLMGGSGVGWLGCYDRTFDSDVKWKGVKEKIKSIIVKERPLKVFTHAPDDPHPNHRSAHRAVMEVVKDMRMPPEVFSFEVWNPVTLKNRDRPRLVVDISDTHKRKIEAFKLHESQQSTILMLLWKIYLKDFFNGWNNKCRYAEVFIKLT